MSIYSLEDAEAFDESLAFVQHLNLQDEVKQTGDYAELEKKEEELVEQEEEDSEDSGADSEAEPELNDLSGKKQTPVTEALRNEHYDRVVLEAIDFETVKAGASFIGNGAMAAGGAIARIIQDLAIILFRLGIKYYPSVADKVKKGILYLFTRSVKSFLRMSTSIVDFAKQHRKSLIKRQNEIAKLKEEITNLKAKASEAGGAIKLVDKSSSDEKTISWMTVSGKTDPNLSLGTMLKFTKEVTEEVDKGFIGDIASVQKLVSFSHNGSVKELFRFMEITPFSSNFMQKQRLQDESQLTESFVYSAVLPDQVLFITTLPSDHLKDISEISKAYHESSVYLTSDNRRPPTVDTVDYMELEGLERFLGGLETICQNAILHIDSYKKAIRACDNLKLGYKSFFQTLTGDTEKKEIHNTLAEFVYLKQYFASRVYLPASMDIRDYTSSYLMRAIRFAKNNLSALQVDEK